jgi:hypothetical protein
MKPHCNNRTCAAAVHFLLSLLIFSLLLFILLKIWYPAPFFSASGGWQGLKIVALIDIVLGPLLTFIVFNTAKPKKELRTDISLIILFQFIVLFWGIHTVYSQRPVAAVFWEDRFYTVPASALEDQGIELSILKRFDDSYPAYIYIRKPELIENWLPVLNKIEEQQIPPHHQVELYQPASSNMAEIYKHSLDIETIISINEDMKKQVEDVLESSQTRLSDNKYIGMKSKYRNIIIIFNKNDNLIGTVSTPYIED